MLRRAERQAADGAQLLLELAGDMGINRQMPGVVRARGHFVDQQPAVCRQEELDAEHADHLQRLENRAGDGDGFCVDCAAQQRTRSTRETSKMPLTWAFSITP